MFLEELYSLKGKYLPNFKFARLTVIKGESISITPLKPLEMNFCKTLLVADLESIKGSGLPKSKSGGLKVLESGILLSDDSAIATQNLITTLGWEDLHDPTYSPDLAPSHIHLFPTLKKNLAGMCFGSNAEVKQAVKRFLRIHSPECFLEGLLKLSKRYDKYLNVVQCFSN
ncbi:histone-lysine N-methyltransferase SETMAR [Trichonephila clavipes]|nr:histone-lysine N-methyltransferase SETMAR [Trichonephila clavipes]